MSLRQRTGDDQEFYTSNKIDFTITTFMCSTLIGTITIIPLYYSLVTELIDFV